MTRRTQMAATVAFWLALGTSAALAQANPLVPESAAPAPRAVLQRVIQEGCAPTRINDVMRAASFDTLAAWLDRQGKGQEARRIRAISDAERREFARNETLVLDILTAGIDGIGKGDRWDSGRNLATATALLGGIDGLVRYVAAAREAQLEVYKRPSTFMFESATPDLATWVKVGPPEAGMTALPNDMRYVGLRAGFEIPYNISRYLLQGTPYARPFSTDPNATTAVNAAALAAVERTRAQQAEALRANGDVPLRQTLAAKMAERPDTQTQPADDGDTALTYAAWLPNLCIIYQQGVAPAYFSQRVIDELYIRPLKTNGAW